MFRPSRRRSRDVLHQAQAVARRQHEHQREQRELQQQQLAVARTEERRGRADEIPRVHAAGEQQHAHAPDAYARELLGRSRCDGRNRRCARPRDAREHQRKGRQCAQPCACGEQMRNVGAQVHVAVDSGRRRCMSHPRHRRQDAAAERGTRDVAWDECAYAVDALAGHQHRGDGERHAQAQRRHSAEQRAVQDGTRGGADDGLRDRQATDHSGLDREPEHAGNDGRDDAPDLQPQHVAAHRPPFAKASILCVTHRVARHVDQEHRRTEQEHRCGVGYGTDGDFHRTHCRLRTTSMSGRVMAPRRR